VAKPQTEDLPQVRDGLSLLYLDVDGGRRIGVIRQSIARSTYNVLAKPPFLNIVDSKKMM